MNGSCFIRLIRQDLQDYLDFVHSRFPDETGYAQFASRN